jgi:choline dehydrogenase-like flavoprotein
MAFVGDVGGIRVAPEDFVMAPTPPPDIDLQAWRDSLALLRGWAPSRLAVTHFGAFDDVSAHLDRMEQSLEVLAERGRDLGEEAFVAAMRADVVAATSPEGAGAYQQGAPFEQCWQGLQRYWRKRSGAGAPIAL